MRTSSTSSVVGLLAAITITACSSGGSAGGGKDAHGAGKNVISAATIYARDLNTGKLVWTVRPPAADLAKLTITNGRLTAGGTQSQRHCEFETVDMSVDPATGAISRVRVERPAPAPPQTPAIIEDSVRVTYYGPHATNTPLPAAKRGPGFPATAPPAPDTSDDPNENTGLIGTTGGGRTLWADLVPGQRGPFPLDPPAHAYGVVVANFGGGNPYTGLGNATLVFLDARTGGLLWSVPTPSAHGAEIVGHRAYIVTDDALQARDLRTGTLIWTRPVRSTVLATTSNREVLWTLDGRLRAYDRAGREIWSVAQSGANAYYSGAPLAAAVDKVFFATPGRYATRCDE